MTRTRLAALAPGSMRWPRRESSGAAGVVIAVEKGMMRVLVWLLFLWCLAVTITSGVGGTVTAPGEGTFTYQNGELVRLETKADSGYTFVKWSGSYSTTENPAILIVKPGSPNPSGVRHPRDLILAGDDDSTPLPDRPNFHCQTAGDSVSYMMCGMPMRGSDCGTGHYHPGGRRSMQLRGTTRTHVMGDSGDVLHIRSEACDQRR